MTLPDLPDQLYRKIYIQQSDVSKNIANKADIASIKSLAACIFSFSLLSVLLYNLSRLTTLQMFLSFLLVIPFNILWLVLLSKEYYILYQAFRVKHLGEEIENAYPNICNDIIKENEEFSFFRFRGVLSPNKMFSTILLSIQFIFPILTSGILSEVTPIFIIA